MISSISQINRMIAGFTDVRDLQVSRDISTGKYQLRMLLENAQAEVVALECHDISNFSLTDFGGGLTQFLDLRAEDMSHRGLDRVSMQFTDRENRSVDFCCASARIGVHPE